MIVCRKLILVECRPTRDSYHQLTALTIILRGGGEICLYYFYVFYMIFKLQKKNKNQKTLYFEQINDECTKLTTFTSHRISKIRLRIQFLVSRPDYEK